MRHPARLLAVLVLALSSVGAPALAAEPMTRDDVTLEWTGNAELQGVPFSGGSNYFSAGQSDGTEATYAASAGNVAIVQRTADGTDSAATYATRAAHVAGGAQIVRVGGGHAEFAADGSGAVSWIGSWTVNFYGGAAPFWIADPVLTVAADGSGALTASVGGYASDMANPSVKSPIAPVADVRIATFHGVTADLTHGFSVSPDFAGVAVALPAGATPQDTTANGWGAWPQSFVDVQQTTGLSSYWYTSGASTDAGKPPTPFAVSVAGAASPLTATALATNPAVETSATTTDAARPTKKGSLLWGVKASFRSYITGPIAQGAVTLSKGATTKKGAYAFAQQGAGKAHGRTGYRGAIRFTGHHGLLDLTLSAPVVRIDSARKATLLLRVNGGERVAFATIDLRAAERATGHATVSYANAPVRIAAAGSAAFSYQGSTFYPVGTALDPISFTIGAPAKAAAPATTAAAYVAPVETPATDAPTPQPTATCAVTDATLSWGFKESFRSYISGTIANGEWTVADGASYATPDFGWSAGAGAFEQFDGRVTFAGSIRFTGHGGVLDTTVANPQLVFADATTAYLLLDVSGPTMDGDEVDETGVSFVQLDLGAGDVSVDGSTITATDVPTTLTAAGHTAFPNYEVGTAFDPVSFTIATASGCADAATVPTPVPAAPTAAPSVGGQGTDLALPLVIVSIIALVLLVIALVLLVIVLVLVVVVVVRLLRARP